MFSEEKRALKRITEKLKKALREELISVTAFGSRVRGDFKGDSDFDVLVIVRQRNRDIIDKIVDIFSQEEISTGIPFSPVVKSEELFEKEREFNTTFYRNIKNEGKILYGKAHN
ncbi:nucleotidyltransferase domain-containing protein [Thermodesulfovibrio sp. TK110]